MDMYIVFNGNKLQSRLKEIFDWAWRRAVLNCKSLFEDIEKPSKESLVYMYTVAADDNITYE